MSSRWKQPSLRSPRVAGVGLVTALVAGTLALAFGTGYVANQAVFSGTSAWLRSDDDDATLVSAAGGAPEDQIGTGAGDVVTNPDGSLGFTSELGDDGTKRTERYEPSPGADDDPEPTGSATIGADATTVVSKERTWVVDPEAGTISERDPRTLKARGKAIEVEGGLVAHALGTDGTLWVLDGEGRVSRVEGRKLAGARTVDLARPDEARLAVAGEQPVVVDPVGGRLVAVGGKTAAVPALEGAELLLVGDQPGPWLTLVAVDGDAHDLVALEATTGELATADLGPDPVGAPLAVADDAYVPSVLDGDQQLRHFALPSLDEVEPVRLPATPAREREPADGDLGFDAFLVGTRVWANDPVSSQALTIGEQEDPTFVDKVDPDATGEDGDAVTDEESDEPEAPAQPTTPVTTPALPPVPSTPQPGGGGLTLGEPAPGSGAPGTGTGTGAGGGAGTPGPGTTVTMPEVPPVPVPDVAGQPFDQACAELARVQLRCAPDAQPDKDRPENEVYAQQPAAEQEAARNSTVTLTFAVWGDVEVPEIAGMDPDTALATLESLGLKAVPTGRTDGAPTEPLDQVIAETVQPAVGTQVKVNDPVAYTYVSDYTDITFNPADLAGRPPADACAALAAISLNNCVQATGDPAPTRDQSGLVYAAAGPEGRTTVDPREAVTVTAYAGYQTKTFALPVFNNCTEAIGWLNANVPGSGCTDDPNGQVAGPTPYGARLGQNPPEGTVVAEDQPFAMSVVSYQPPTVALTDWAVRNSATHTLRPEGAGAPGSGDGGTSPNDWVDGGRRGVFFATQQPGTAPILCYLLEGGLRNAHHCGTAPPPAPGQGTWRATYGGQPMAWAYPGDVGFGVRHKTCVLYRPEGGVNKLIGQYYTGTDRACATPTTAGDFYVDGGEVFTTPG